MGESKISKIEEGHKKKEPSGEEQLQNQNRRRRSGSERPSIIIQVVGGE